MMSSEPRAHTIEQDPEQSSAPERATPEVPGIRIVALILLFATAALMESVRLFSLTSLTGSDVWSHLQTGIWILQNHALPHNGIYSQSADAPWIAAGWLYDFTLGVSYRILGISAVPLLLMLLRTALALVTFRLAGGVRGNFWAAIGISVVTQYVLGTMAATPSYCSAVLFGIELLLLLEYGRTSRTRNLFWMPALFAVWANVSPQFAYGIGLLVIFVVAFLYEERSDLSRARKLVLPLVASLLATLLTPYFVGTWRVFVHGSTSEANKFFPDYLAMNFHEVRHYLLLLMVMSAFLALGLRRSRDWFLISMLAACTAMSFHSQRDMYLASLASIAVLGELITESGIALQGRTLSNRAQWVGASVAFAVVIVTFAALVPHRREVLLSKMAQSYPVGATDYMREHRLPQPLFNAYEWGGFLMWYQPEIPVAIDGRTDLYSADTYETYSKVMNAEVPYSADLAIAQARTIILPRHSILAEALSSVQGFRVAYQDDVASVLIAEQRAVQ